MANQQRGEVVMEIGGRSYTFRLTTSAMAALEDACSTPDRPMYFPKVLEAVYGGSAKHIILFVWASLLDHHPDITAPEASKLIDEAGGLISFSTRLQTVVAASQPDAEDLRPQKAQANGAGGRSTSKRAKLA